VTFWNHQESGWLLDFACAVWIEGIGEWRGDVDAMTAFILGGPPGR